MINQPIPGDSEQSNEFHAYLLIGKLYSALDLQDRRNLVLRQSYQALREENTKLQQDVAELQKSLEAYATKGAGPKKAVDTKTK